MFKAIIESRKRTTLVHDALQEVLNMLERAEGMFGAACGALLNKEEVIADIDRADREINAGERMVRRLIFEHLTLNPQQDLPATLALISIVHNVERLGDYAKSLLELNQWAELYSNEGQYAPLCRDMHAAIAPLFGQVAEALRQSDADVARQVMRQHEEIKERSDAFIKTAMEDAGSQREAVLYTLASRFLRRTSAHLSNIASSVANPVDRVTGKEV